MHREHSRKAEELRRLKHKVLRDQEELNRAMQEHRLRKVELEE